MQRLVFIFSGGESLCLKILLAETDAADAEVKSYSSWLSSWSFLAIATFSAATNAAKAHYKRIP